MPTRLRHGRSLTAGMLLLAGLISPGPVLAAGECLANQYQLCVGECPTGSTDQGECTTRQEATGGTDVRWCCCPDGYTPDEITLQQPAPANDDQCTSVVVVDADAPPPADEPADETEDQVDDVPPADTPGDDGPKPPNGWAASSAVRMTAQPEVTETTLDKLRDGVLMNNPRTARYVPLIERLADEIDTVFADDPALAEQTARLMDGNLRLILRLVGGEKVEVDRQTVERVDAVMAGMAEAKGAGDELRKALQSARQDLRDPELLGALGVRVKP